MKEQDHNQDPEAQIFDPGGLDNFDLGELDIDINPGLEAEPMRYMPPTRCEMRDDQVLYDNAVALAKHLKIGQIERCDALINGTFIFGDFIEAFMTTHNVHSRRMIITTLSMSQDNIDSLANLLNGGFIDKLDLIISDYFYAHERNVLVPYLYRELDKGDRFQLSVASVHTKTVQFITDGGKHVVIHGSANLRTSGNIEQFTIEDNPSLYKFYEDAWGSIIEKYHTINHSLRSKELWECIDKKRFNN